MTSRKIVSNSEQHAALSQGYMPYHFHDDEIDLRELLHTIKKRKSTLFFTTLALLLPALLYIWLATPIYEAKALVQIGSIGSKAVEKPLNLKTKLEAIYHINDKNIKIEYPYISAVSVPKKSDGLIQLTALGTDTKSAKEKIFDVSSNLESEHGKIIEKYTELKREHLKAKKSEAERLKAEIAEVSSTLADQKRLLSQMVEKGVSGGTDLLAVEYSQNLERVYSLQSLLSDTISEINDLEIALSPVNIKKTALVGEIVTYDHPVKPKKTLIVAISVVTGLMLGLLLIFFLEWIGKSTDKPSPAAH